MTDTTQFVTLRAFYPVVLIVSYEVGVHHQLYAAGHSWRDYIYSPSTLYGAFLPCAIRKVTTVFAWDRAFSLHRICPVLQPQLLVSG